MVLPSPSFPQKYFLDHSMCFSTFKFRTLSVPSKNIPVCLVWPFNSHVIYNFMCVFITSLKQIEIRSSILKINF